MKPETHVTFAFGSSHHALWAEDLARERDLPVEVVPAPASADAKCGLALRIAGAQAAALEEVCREQGIPLTRSGES